MKYFQIKNQLLELVSLILENGIEEYKDTLEGLSLELQEKANFYSQILVNSEQDIAYYQKIVSKYKSLIDKRKNTISFIEEALIDMHNTFGVNSITDTDSNKIFNIKVRETEAVEVKDVSSLPSDYVREKMTREPDKVAIKKAIKEGLIVPDENVFIVKNKHLNLT